MVDGACVEVRLDSYDGPFVLQDDGVTEATIPVALNSDVLSTSRSAASLFSMCKKSWSRMSSTEQKVLLHKVAQRNKATRDQVAEKALASYWASQDPRGQDAGPPEKEDKPDPDPLFLEYMANCFGHNWQPVVFTGARGVRTDMAPILNLPVPAWRKARTQEWTGAGTEESAWAQTEESASAKTVEEPPVPPSPLSDSDTSPLVKKEYGLWNPAVTPSEMPEMPPERPSQMLPERTWAMPPERPSEMPPKKTWEMPPQSLSESEVPETEVPQMETEEDGVKDGVEQEAGTAESLPKKVLERHITDLLKDKDLESTSLKMVRARLEERLGLPQDSLLSRKAEVRSIVTSLVTKRKVAMHQQEEL